MTDTAVLTLADFLLARIDDEHTVAIDALAMHSDMVEPDTRVVADGTVQGGPAVVVGVERMLADCEARRRIVTDYKRYRAEWPTGDESPAVLALALPYTEHPDFNPAWR